MHFFCKSSHNTSSGFVWFCGCEKDFGVGGLLDSHVPIGCTVGGTSTARITPDRMSWYTAAARVFWKRISDGNPATTVDPLPVHANALRGVTLGSCSRSDDRQNQSMIPQHSTVQVPWESTGGGGAECALVLPGSAFGSASRDRQLPQSKQMTNV